jgi:hypothetical protein
VHAQLGAPSLERISDESGIVDVVMPDHDDSHQASFGRGLNS